MPQQNGVAERMNRTLINLVRSVLHQRGIPKRFWAEGLSTATYIQNRVTPLTLEPRTTLHHLFFGFTPDLSHLKVFSSRCCYLFPSQKLRKFDARSRGGMIVGYSTVCKGYKNFYSYLQKIFIARIVHFDERTVQYQPQLRIEGTITSLDISSTQNVKHSLNDYSPINRKSSRINDVHSVPSTLDILALQPSVNEYFPINGELSPRNDFQSASSSPDILILDTTQVTPRRSSPRSQPPDLFGYVSSQINHDPFQIPTSDDIKWNYECFLTSGLLCDDIPRSYS